MNRGRLTIEASVVPQADAATRAVDYYNAGYLCLLYAQTLMRLLSLIDGDRAAEELEVDVDFNNIGEVCELFIHAGEECFDKARSAYGVLIGSGEEKGGA